MVPVKTLNKISDTRRSSKLVRSTTITTLAMTLPHGKATSSHGSPTSYSGPSMIRKECSSCESLIGSLLVLYLYDSDLGRRQKIRTGESIKDTLCVCLGGTERTFFTARAGKLDWSKTPHPKMQVRKFVVEGCRVD
jgi:hypothetical protein